MNAIALVLLLATNASDRNAIQPNVERVAEAAKSPETLWALLIDEKTTYDDRMYAATLAGGVLPARYLPLIAAVDDEVHRDPWVILGGNTIEDWRKMPWFWQMQEALQKIRIDAGAEAIEFLRDVPCTNERESRAMLRAFRRLRPAPETFGLLRNIALRRDERDLLQEGALWAFEEPVAHDHGEWGMQAFITDLAPVADREFLRVLASQVASMRKGKTPYTAFLAVAQRLRDPDDATTLLRTVGRHPMSADGPRELREYLEKHSVELRKGAAAERAAIDAARARMMAVTLCR